jgi:hypothetical protein
MLNDLICTKKRISKDYQKIIKRLSKDKYKIVFIFHQDQMNAAILFMTDQQIDCNKTNIREQIEDILDDSDNFKMTQYTDNDNLFMLIHNTLSTEKTLNVTVCNVWENIGSLYEGYFVDIAEIENQDNQQDNKNKDTKIRLNEFSSQITSQHVTGALVIVKRSLEYLITENNVKTTTKPCSFSYNELLDILESKFIKNGIMIDVDGSIKSYKYIMNPIEHLILTDSDYSKNYVYHEYEVYTHVMVIFAKVNALDEKINEKASLLAGAPVNGSVHVVLYKKPEYNESPPYVSLDPSLLESIFAIRSRGPSLTTGMEKSNGEYINFEKILDLETKKHANKPIIRVDEITGECLNVGI